VLITLVLRWLGEEVSPDADTEPITVQPARVEIDPADPLAALGLADPRA